MDLALQSLPFLTKGLAITLQVSGLVVVLSLLAGVLRAWRWSTGRLPLRLLVRGYSDIIRGIPVLILIFAIYYGLPALRSTCPAWPPRWWPCRCSPRPR